MLAPEPRFERNSSLGEVSFSHSATSAESSSRSRPPLCSMTCSRVVDWSLGCSGLGSGDAAHVVLSELRAFLERVSSSRLSRLRSGELEKLISTCRCLISSRLWIWIWEYVGLAFNGCGWGGEGLGRVAATWLYILVLELTFSEVSFSCSWVCCSLSDISEWDLVSCETAWK